MNKNFQKIEKDLRSIAKRYKSVKYSIGLVILFLMMGLNAFSEEVNTDQNVSNSVETIATREDIKDSVEGLQGKIKDARAENTKSIESLRLELVQLMEQGNQVVKSPWSSWQFGINYMYDNWSGTYKGSGDKPPKYVYNSIYRRGNWEERNAIDTIAGKSVDGDPITPGNENTSAWQTATTPTGVTKLKRDTSIDASTNGKREWGLVELRKIREPLNEVEIFANVSPKEVKKDKLDIPVSVTPPATLSAPVVKPNVNKPTEAPKVDLPKPPKIEIPGDPNLSFNPTISVLKVEKVGNITVNPANVTPVDFILAPSGLTDDKTRYFLNNAYNLNGQTINVNNNASGHKNYISTWGRVTGLDGVTTNVDVTVADTRAFMIDEGIDKDNNIGIAPFNYKGVINLKKSQNVGIDVQGTHTVYGPGAYVNTESKYNDINTVANVVVTNSGTINGIGGPNVKNQVAFGFNNFDASTNNTRTKMVNAASGTIKLDAEESVGIQLRPEDPNASGASDRLGLNMMAGENDGTITLNGAGSFGILTVKNKNPNTKALAAPKTYNNYGVTTSAGGQIASRAQEGNKSFVKNTNIINVESDNSIGVGILNSIQSVEVGGYINIGKAPTLATYADKAGGVSGKVDGAVGVYTEEATRPVKGRVYTYTTDSKGVTTEHITAGGIDDHGLENTIGIEDKSQPYTDSTGAIKYKRTGKQVGTDTVEVSAKITLGSKAEKSFGLRNSNTGSITLVGGGKVILEGENNFGALSNAAAGKININNGAEIKGTGKESIGYVMLKGTGVNAGTIDVEGATTNTATSKDYNGSIGFYGVKGTFTNTSTGKIITSGTLAHSVVLKQNSTTQGEMTFNHYGEINVSSASTKPGNIGVYSDGYALANFYNGAKIYVGNDSIGVHTSRIDGFNHTFINEGTLGIKIGARSTFAYLDADGTLTETTLKEFFGNGKVVIESNMGEKSSLVYANNKAKALLDADLTIDKGNANASTIALLATNKSVVTVDSGKALTTNTQVALAAVNGTTTAGSGSTAENKGTIVSNRENKGIGIYAKETGSKAINDGTITMNGKEAAGMYGEDITIFENKAGKSIEVKEEKSVGMYAKATGTNTLTVKNDGKITTNKLKSVGIYLKNETTAPAVAKLTASNNEIEIKGGEESIGIYAPKSTVSKVGKITMADAATKSIAVYLSDGAQATTAAKDEIDLGKSTKNIAYFLKNKDTGFGTSTVIGKVSGYGVGIYLEGTSATDKAELTATSPALNFTTGNDSGNGIVGLYLKGDTDISAYNKKITVGDTVTIGKDIAPAIAIYSEKQGVSGTPYVIKADIQTGAKAVGIFSAPDTPAVPPATSPTPNKSYIKYLGSQMDLGEGSTGFYVNGKTELDTTNKTTTINLDGGLVAYVTQNSEFVGGKSEVNLSKSGIGVYGERGAKVDVGSWTFNNNGNAAEEVRLKEGIAKVTTDKTLKPKMVLTHVINGETYLDSGKSVTAIADPTNSAIAQEENIGLMAQGLKNTKVGITWDKGNDYEIINEGTIDFTTSNKSTAIYAESARVKNAGTIKLGESSTGIYGVYRDDSPKFEDAGGTKYPNKLEIDTTATSSISLKKGSTGMYLVNAEKLNTAAGGTIQSVAGETNNVGIYAINGVVDVPTTGTPAEIAEANAYNNKNTNFKSLTMTNNSNITLGNGSVGIYTRGQSDTLRNTVTNDGNITVGDTLTGAPAVGIYAENTNLTQGNTGTPDITVGEKGIALYGKNSTITAKGTVNYSNKGILGYFENSTFTSHYGDLTAHQNTILFLKNSTANMNGAGTDIDITVPDKAATSDSFAGVYVEGTSTLNGVKKITVGENSNGIFMKDATFTSNVTDIESTKEGAKGLLALESDLTNNSKITLSGDSSIGIYSDASNTKTVTNNGKLTISGKKTLGVFLKGSQTFINTADIDVADTTSSVPAEKTVGIYTKDGTSTIKHNSGTIDVGTKSIGIFSATNSGVEVDTPAKINVKDEAIGIYKEKGTALLKGEIDVAAHTSTTKNSEPVGLYGLNGANITDSASKITVGAKSFGFILENETTATTNQYTSTGAGTVSLGDDSVFLYSNGQASLTNGRDISSNSKRLIGFYIKGNGTNRGDLTNNATIDFSNSLGSIGIYAPGGKATNNGRILVGETDSIDPATGKTYTDVSKIIYGIGMAADNGGHIINNNEIRIYGDKSIGMYGKGVGTTVENNGTIFLDGSRATATNKIQSMIGVYVDEGAKFINYGDIRTADAYAGKDVGGTIKVDDNVSGLVGVAVMNGSTLENYGNIDIDANESYGVVIRGKSPTQPAVIKNYGNFRINVRGRGTYGVSYKDISAADLAALEAIVNSKLKSDATGQELVAAAGTDKSYEGVSITIQNGKPIFTRNGVPVSDSEVEKIEKIIGNATSNLGMSDVGFYIDTLGRTKPIDINGATPPINSQLIVGTEYSELTNKKEWFVKDDVIAPFLQQIQGRNFKLTSIAGSLTWMATPVLDNYGQIKGVAMTKLPYTAFVEKSHNAWNFADGLEQRYGMNALDSREKRVFNLLNSIGNNEEILLTQAYDEMMGHQYANVQQRIYETGNILNREFSYLRNAWSNPTKDANKIKVFGTNGEYKTDTAGIIDYKYNAQGVAYVHEDESVKLGETVGWYAGLVHNRYKFEDIGRSKEEMLQGKVGMFKSVPFDDNNSLNWTISGDIFVGYNKMHRRFLVVSEIFNAKSRYYSYGLGVKNELSKEFRLSEGFALKPYGALRLEYGRMSKIRERSGEVKLEVKSNDYISIKPEIGAELSYRAFFGSKSLKAAVTVAYENELGVLANPKNKARVAGTSADWFNIRGEKEDRRGNVKTDLNIGVDNQRIGVTANVGYDTKGSNIRGGLGLRVIF